MRVSIAAARMRAVAAGDTAQVVVIDQLQAAVADLEDALGMNDAAVFPRRMAPAERKILGILLRRASATKDQLMQAIYAGRNGADMPNDPAAVFKVQMHRLRRRLKPDGITIETILGARGDYETSVYRISAEDKAKASAIMAGATRSDIGDAA